MYTVHFVGLSRRNEICDGSHARANTHDEIERHLFQFQQQHITVHKNDFERDFPFIPLLLRLLNIFLSLSSFLVRSKSFCLLCLMSVCVSDHVSSSCAHTPKRVYTYSWHHFQSSFCFAQHVIVWTQKPPQMEHRWGEWRRKTHYRNRKLESKIHIPSERKRGDRQSPSSSF